MCLHIFLSHAASVIYYVGTMTMVVTIRLLQITHMNMTVPEAQQAMPHGLLNYPISRIPPGHAQRDSLYHDRTAQPVSRDYRLVMPGERGTRRPPSREGSPPPRACDIHYGINPASVQCDGCRKCGLMLDWTRRYCPPAS